MFEVVCKGKDVERFATPLLYSGRMDDWDAKQKCGMA
jgi:hypothetical protein